MRPPILQWKVMLALVAVVIVGISLGSGLHSDGTPYRTFYVSKINSGVTGSPSFYGGGIGSLVERFLLTLGGGTQSGGTGYPPGFPQISHETQLEKCANIKSVLSSVSKYPGIPENTLANLLREMRRVCHTHG
jgi:hypothetical protein